MKGRKRSSVFTGALLVLAIAALLFGGIGSARAVLTPSDEYIADIGTKDIALVLNENGEGVLYADTYASTAGAAKCLTAKYQDTPYLEDLRKIIK